MKNKVIKIPASELMEGMVVSKNFIVNNIRLLNKDVEISQRIANKIKETYPEALLEVYYPDNSLLSSYKKETKASMIEAEDFFKRVTHTCFKMFSRLEVRDDPDINMVRNLSKELLTTDIHQEIMIKNITTVRNLKDYDLRHSINTAILSVLIGRWLGYSPRNLKLLSYAALLHDIGKEKIDEKILYKPGALTENEYNMVKLHSQLGYEILKKIPFLDSSVAIAVLMHHEREDGSGYPFGIKGDSISSYGKIIAIADTFDAMTSNRVYKERISPLSALEEIRDCSFKTLDPKLCHLFIKNMMNLYIGNQILLSNGATGTIIKMDINSISKPLIITDQCFINLSASKDLHIVDII
ncbi:HD-GYP domain-containing protein [Alloiococcus sp. CFN-8]|uniref:HD-GYP domain-containing protein n=1 Tax=Alloiococcus sp. CFN-8 TaxID=3416081 RepID=UPI003CEBF640